MWINAMRNLSSRFWFYLNIFAEERLGIVDYIFCISGKLFRVAALIISMAKNEKKKTDRDVFP